MNSQQELDAMVSMIMVNLPFPPMPVQVCRATGDEASCSSHDLMSRAISCSMFQCWQELDHVTPPNVDSKMQVLINLNQQNAELHKQDCVPTQAIYEMFAHGFRKYMSFYPGSPDLRVLPYDTVDQGSTIYKQAAQHLAAKRFNVQDSRTISEYTSYAQILQEYSSDLYSEREQ